MQLEDGNVKRRQQKIKQLHTCEVCPHQRKQLSDLLWVTAPKLQVQNFVRVNQKEKVVLPKNDYIYFESLLFEITVLCPKYYIFIQIFIMKQI